MNEFLKSPLDVDKNDNIQNRANQKKIEQPIAINLP